MTSFSSIRSIAVILGAVTLAACEKNAVQDITGTLPSARIKFFNFGVNTPAVNFYANNNKITAVLSATGIESTNGVAAGGAGSGGFYSAIAPGPYTFSGRIAAAVDKDLSIAEVPTTLADGKAYSMFISGIYNTTTQKADGFVVEDPFIENNDFSVASVRFVNAISNANPMTLFALNTTTGAEVPIGAAVPYKSAGAFTTVPAGVYTVSTRYPGSTTNVITRTALNFVGGRVLTIGSRGDITVTSTTLATRPLLDITANR